MTEEKKETVYQVLGRILKKKTQPTEEKKPGGEQPGSTKR